jgi:predicted transcriptional regulator
MKRSKIEIRADILSHVNNGVESPTEIMYMAGCNWRQIGSHLYESLEQGLLEYRVPAEGGIEKRKHYMITEKGKDFLSSFQEAKHLVGIESDIFAPTKMAKAANSI